ncbi:MAG: hyaluronan synthase [Myxococcota bacterium]
MTLLPWLGVLVSVMLGIRVVLWLCYRPTGRVDAASLPTLTVVIPAFNEGRGVLRAIESVLASDYPAEKLHVIAVNDGSTDDTGVYIDEAIARFPTRFTGLHQPTNLGKREAVFRGFRQATSEIIATVDSDSMVPPESLANLVSPLVIDPAVSGVAGKVLVLNRGENLLTRMLGVRYILGFDFIRAYQSVLRTVWCCPGALQAYRRETVAPHFERWARQTFLGARCTNGDDHAMTNMVLSLGQDTVYQSTAEVLTLVPTTYRQLTRMYTRWGRSATREGLRALVFTPRRVVSMRWWRGPLVALDAVLQPLTILARVVGFGAALVLLVTDPLWLAKAALATTVIAVGYGLIYLRSERSREVIFAVLYGWYALLLLPWVQPWATLTVRGNKWLTRGS